MDQVTAIRKSTRAQASSVCSDSSLSPQQKQEKIRDVRKSEHAQIDGLISTQQQGALHTCRVSRGHVGGTHGGGGENPYGAPANASAPAKDSGKDADSDDDDDAEDSK